MLVSLASLWLLCSLTLTVLLEVALKLSAEAGVIITMCMLRKCVVTVSRCALTPPVALLPV